MIIFMSDIICVTNRSLCRENFLSRIEKIAVTHPAAIILREKDLSEAEYEKLARQVIAVCNKHQTPCILHTFTKTAQKLNHSAIHLPLSVLRTLTPEEKSYFSVIGSSCHSMEDALEAQQLGCTYITVGHIFATDCKKGVPPRGLDFLEDICKLSQIPVFAIGGINRENISDIYRCGAKGACIMSGFMQSDDAKLYLYI